MKKLILIFLFIVTTATAQKSITVVQDVKLLTYENSHGLTAPTLDFIVKYNGLKIKELNINLCYERANLFNSIYNKYSIDFWSYNLPIVKKVKLKPMMNIGAIYRFNTIYYTYGFASNLSYKISNSTSLILLSTIDKRNDIGNEYRFNNYLGLKFKL